MFYSKCTCKDFCKRVITTHDGLETIVCKNCGRMNPMKSKKIMNLSDLELVKTVEDLIIPDTNSETFNRAPYYPFEPVENKPQENISEESKSKINFILRLLTKQNFNSKGHSTIELNDSFSFDELKVLMDEVESYYKNSEGRTCLPTYRSFTDGSGMIALDCFWQDGEHELGHTDKVLLTWTGRVSG